MAGLLLNCLVKVNWVNLGVVVRHYLSIAVNNEFSKVPWDLSGLLGLGIVELRVISQVSVDFTGISAVHLNL